MHWLNESEKAHPAFTLIRLFIGRFWIVRFKSKTEAKSELSKLVRKSEQFKVLFARCRGENFDLKISEKLKQTTLFGGV